VTRYRVAGAGSTRRRRWTLAASVQPAVHAPGRRRVFGCRAPRRPPPLLDARRLPSADAGLLAPVPSHPPHLAPATRPATPSIRICAALPPSPG